MRDRLGDYDLASQVEAEEFSRPQPRLRNTTGARYAVDDWRNAYGDGENCCRPPAKY